MLYASDFVTPVSTPRLTVRGMSVLAAHLDSPLKFANPKDLAGVAAGLIGCVYVLADAAGAIWYVGASKSTSRSVLARPQDYIRWAGEHMAALAAGPDVASDLQDGLLDHAWTAPIVRMIAAHHITVVKVAPVVQGQSVEVAESSVAALCTMVSGVPAFGSGVWEIKSGTARAAGWEAAQTAIERLREAEAARDRAAASTSPAATDA